MPGDRRTVLLRGELDIAEVSRLLDTRTAALATTCDLVVDLAEVTFIDSTIIGALITTRQAARRRQANASPS